MLLSLKLNANAQSVVLRFSKSVIVYLTQSRLHSNMHVINSVCSFGVWKSSIGTGSKYKNEAKHNKQKYDFIESYFYS